MEIQAIIKNFPVSPEEVEDGIRAYETMFVINPSQQENIDRAIEWFENFLKLRNVKVEKFEKIGLKNFAYPIKHLTQGYYVLCEFWSEPSTPLELEAQFKLRPEIIRFLILRSEDKEEMILNPAKFEKKLSKRRKVKKEKESKEGEE